MTLGHKLYCLIGPSGTGKDAVKFGLQLPYVVSYRTRKMRDGEVEGRDGYFIDEETFFRMNREEQWIAKTYYSGNYYAVTQGEVLHLETSPMTYVIDYPGVEALRQSFDDMKGYDASQVIAIHINSDERDLYKRMQRRGDDQGKIDQRIKYYREHEKDLKDKCDYSVKNQTGALPTTLNEIYRIILHEETGAPLI